MPCPLVQPFFPSSVLDETVPEIGNDKKINDKNLLWDGVNIQKWEYFVKKNRPQDMGVPPSYVRAAEWSVVDYTPLLPASSNMPIFISNHRLSGFSYSDDL